MKQIALLVILAGMVLAGIGLLMLGFSRWQWFGHLPGDIHVHGRRWSFHFPLVTCLLLSVLLTVVLNLLARFLKR